MPKKQPASPAITPFDGCLSFAIIESPEGGRLVYIASKTSHVELSAATSFAIAQQIIRQYPSDPFAGWCIPAQTADASPNIHAHYFERKDARVYESVRSVCGQWNTKERLYPKLPGARYCKACERIKAKRDARKQRRSPL